MPEHPRSSELQNSAALRPRAEMAPMPVVTARRIRLLFLRLRAGRLRYQFFDALDHLPDAADLLGLLVGNRDVELVFQREQDIDAVHRIDAQLLERAVDGDFFGADPLGGGDNLEHSLGQLVGHSNWLTVSNVKPRDCRTGMSRPTASSVAPMSGLA